MPNEEPLSIQNLIARLQEAVPEFEPDQDDIRDRLNYLVFNSLISYIQKLNPEQDREQLRRIFTFLETAAQSGEKATEDVIRDTLWGLASYSDIELYKPLLGRHSQQLLRQVPLR